MSSPFGRAWSTNGPNALPSARVDGRANPFAAPAATPTTGSFGFPAQPKQVAWGLAWTAQPPAAQPPTGVNASPFAPAAPKTVFGSVSVTGASSTSATTWGSFPPAASRAASTASPATGTSGWFPLGQQPQAPSTGTSTFTWNSQQQPQPSSISPFATVGGIGTQQPAVNPTVSTSAWPGTQGSQTGNFMYCIPPRPSPFAPKPTQTLANGSSSGSWEGFSNDSSMCRPVEKKPSPIAAPVPAWTFPWTSQSSGTTAASDTKAPSPWALPPAVPTQRKAPQSTWSFPTSTGGTAPGAKTTANASAVPASANNSGFKFTWTPSATPATVGASTWKQTHPTSTPTVSAPPVPTPQPPAAPQFLIAQADVDPYGAGSFGAGLVERQVQAVVKSSSASSPGKPADESTASLSLTPAPRRRPPPALANRVGLSPNATIFRPKQPAMMLQSLRGSSRSSWTRNEFRRPGSLFHR